MTHDVCDVCMCCKGGPKAPVTATKRLASGGGDHMVRIWRLVLQ